MRPRYSDWGTEEDAERFVSLIKEMVNSYRESDPPGAEMSAVTGLVRENSGIYSIREVWYKNGVPDLCELPSNFVGNSIEEIRKHLIHVLYNLDKPAVEGVPRLDIESWVIVKKDKDGNKIND
jgi:hypothetical protein